MLYKLDPYIIRNPNPMLIDGSPIEVVRTAGNFDDFQDVPILWVLRVKGLEQF